MITKKDYQKARELIDTYEKQIKETIDSPCYILVCMNSVSTTTFVTTDKAYADRLYATGDYIMHISKLINPLTT